MKPAAHLLCILAATAFPAWGQLHKCLGEDGRVRYSDRACQGVERQAAIVAAPIASPTAQDAEAAERRRSAANERGEALDRKAARAAADNRATDLSGASARVARIKAENGDPGRCWAARHRLAVMQRRDPIGWRMDVSAFEFQQQVALYCGQ